MGSDPCFTIYSRPLQSRIGCQDPVPTKLEFPPTYNQRYAFPPPMPALLRFNSSSTPTLKLHIIRSDSVVSYHLIPFLSNMHQTA